MIYIYITYIYMYIYIIYDICIWYIYIYDIYMIYAILKESIFVNTTGQPSALQGDQSSRPVSPDTSLPIAALILWTFVSWELQPRLFFMHIILECEPSFQNQLLLDRLFLLSLCVHQFLWGHKSCPVDHWLVPCLPWVPTTWGRPGR